MAIEKVSEYQLGDMLLVFEEETDFKHLGFSLIPVSMRDRMVTDRKFYRINNLAQLKLTGDRYPNCYGHGNTMHNSETGNLFGYVSQEKKEEKDKTRILTHFRDQRGYTLTNIITYYHGEQSFEMKNVIVNESEETITLEMLASFEMGNITPFAAGIAPDTLLLHRLRSKWSHEGRLVTETIEDLQLEPSWSNWAVGVERFGARGSMPVMKYFPFVGVEDKKNHVLWGAQLRTESSWQIEVYRQDDGLHISGGLADREFGHWMKDLAPGARFETPTAVLTVCTGDIDELCHRLVTAGEKYLADVPASEQELPVLFNEYCTTWGCPSHENITGILDAIRGKGFDYFVIDCGWFKEDGVPWDISMGDYNISPSLFPQGLDRTVAAIRDAGMKPGISLGARRRPIRIRSIC